MAANCFRLFGMIYKLKAETFGLARAQLGEREEIREPCKSCLVGGIRGVTGTFRGSVGS